MLMYRAMQTNPYDDDYLPIGEVARQFGVAPETIRRWEAEGKIASTRTLGGQRRFSRAEVERVKAEAGAA